MKTILGVVVLSLFLPCMLHGRDRIIDSLRIELNRTENTRQKIDLLLKISDLSEGSDEELHDAFELFGLAESARDLFAMLVPTGTIVEHYVSTPSGMDSIKLFLSNLEKYFKGTEYEGAVAYYRMVSIARELQLSPKENRKAVCDRIMKEISVAGHAETVYDQVARLFLSGVIAYQLTTLTFQPTYEVGLPYWEEGYDIIQSFPVKIRRNFAANYITLMLPAYAFKVDKEKLLAVSENYLGMVDVYFEDPEISSRRPYISKSLSYLLCYQILIQVPDIIGQEKATEYFNRYRNFVYSPKNNGILRNYAFFYRLCVGYYCNLKEYDKALAYSDSLISMSRRGNEVINYEVDLYKGKADIYRQMGDWKNAVVTAKEMIRINDSIASYRYVNNIEQMLVQIETDKLALENGALIKEQREKMTAFAVILIVLMCSVSVIVWMVLHKQKKLQQQIYIQSIKARESDRLKNYFMENIYSDILAPLNQINTEADLLFAENVSMEAKKEKADRIQKSAVQIITLMDASLNADELKQES